jgi:hypothetical protein
MAYPAPTDFDTIVGCLRLSHKYEVDYLRRRALVHFSSGHCTTLAAEDASDSEVLTLGWQSWGRRNKPASFPILAIRLAREVDALWTLPTRFISCPLNSRNSACRSSMALCTMESRSDSLYKIRNPFYAATTARAEALFKILSHSCTIRWKFRGVLTLPLAWRTGSAHLDTSAVYLGSIPAVRSMYGIPTTEKCSRRCVRRASLC